MTKMKRTWIALMIVTVALVGIGTWRVSHRDSSPLPKAATAPISEEQVERAGRPLPLSPVSPPVVRGAFASSKATADKPGFALDSGRQSGTATPASVRTIVAPNADDRVGIRLTAVHALSSRLSTDEIQALYVFLLSRGTAQDKSTQVLKNDVLDKLCSQDNPPGGFTGVLVGIYQDQQQDPVMRDYAVQHMPTAHEKGSDEERATLNQAMWKATEETDSSIAGTALLALLEVVGPMPSSGNGIGSPPTAEAEPRDRARLAETALRLASDERCGELARITAVQVCGRMGAIEIVPTALELAHNTGSIPLSIAAIATLGDVGGLEVRADLQKVARGDNTRLQTPAQGALLRLNRRLGL